MEKTLYKGVFNWYGELHTFYRHAYSLAQAKLLMLKELAKLVGRRSVWGYYDGRRDNFSLEEVIK